MKTLTLVMETTGHCAYTVEVTDEDYETSQKQFGFRLWDYLDERGYEWKQIGPLYKDGCEEIESLKIVSREFVDRVKKIMNQS